MSFKIYPYKRGSRSARVLADALNGRVLRLENSNYVERQRDTIINWGSSNRDIPYNNVLNRPERVNTAGNKLFAFTALRDTCSIPDYWVRREEIPDEAFPIVCRTILTGHSGAGIVIADTREELVDAPLYVKYVKKRDEYRIHVGKREELTSIISIQRKAVRNGERENANFRIRNVDNGFVFVRNDVVPPSAVLEQAKAALCALGLDFGAVDVIWNERQEKAYVLEVNCAPGLEGQTVQDYATYFRGLV